VTVQNDAMTFDAYIQGQLFERRIVLARGAIDEVAATNLAAQLLTLDANADQPIQLHLSSPGGDLGAALTLADTIRVLAAELTVTAVGEVSGAAIAVFAASPKRTSYPHARFGLKEPESKQLTGTATDLGTHAQEYLRQRGNLVELLATATGRQAEAVDADLRTGRYLSAEEAVGYGLIQSVKART
jgi:ATP-dependent Clp protease, protease subunit